MEGTDYTVYILSCADGTYYTGIARDMARRLLEHNESDKGAKYTKGRRPVTLMYEEVVPNRSEAQKREYVLRHLTHAEKRSLVMKQARK